MDLSNPVCSVPSVEVLLSVAVVSISGLLVVPPALVRDKIRVLLTMEALVVLMSMEASIVLSKLRIVFLNAVVKGAPSCLLV